VWIRGEGDDADAEGEIKGLGEPTDARAI